MKMPIQPIQTDTLPLKNLSSTEEPKKTAKESTEDMLAQFVGVVAGLQAKVAKFSIEDRDRELAMGQREEHLLAQEYQKAKAAYEAYEKAKAEADSKPAWERALIGVATLGMSELGPVLEQGFTSMLHDMGIHNGPLLTYLSKALTITTIVAIMVVATALTGGVADAAMAGSVSEDAAAGGAEEAADASADAGADSSEQAGKTLVNGKVLSFGLAQGLQSTNLVTSIAKDAGANQWEMDMALGIQIATALVLGGYGITGEGAAFSGLANVGEGASRAIQFGKAVEGLCSLAAAGYGGYQAKKQMDVSHDLNDLAPTQKRETLLTFAQEQYNQGLKRSNAVVAAALRKSPNAVASELTKGYRVPDYLI
jgi:hypothetical protein